MSILIGTSFWRDANSVPIAIDGITSGNVKSMVGNNTTTAVPLFTVTGAIEVRAIYGVVTTALGANHTAAYWRLNDQSAQANITLNTGTTLSAKGVGTTLVKKGLATAALVALDSAAGVVSEPTSLETPYFSPFTLVAKNGATTNIEYVYTTTDTPTSGAIQFFVRWLPLSADANVTAL